MRSNSYPVNQLDDQPVPLSAYGSFNFRPSLIVGSAPEAWAEPKTPPSPGAKQVSGIAAYSFAPALATHR